MRGGHLAPPPPPPLLSHTHPPPPPPLCTLGRLCVPSRHGVGGWRSSRQPGRRRASLQSSPCCGPRCVHCLGVDKCWRCHPLLPAPTPLLVIFQPAATCVVASVRVCGVPPGVLAAMVVGTMVGRPMGRGPPGASAGADGSGWSGERGGMLSNPVSRSVGGTASAGASGPGSGGAPMRALGWGCNGVCVPLHGSPQLPDACVVWPRVSLRHWQCPWKWASTTSAPHHQLSAWMSPGVPVGRAAWRLPQLRLAPPGARSPRSVVPVLAACTLRVAAAVYVAPSPIVVVHPPL